jgi:hypothetical protein
MPRWPAMPERFWSKVDRRDQGGCWEWQGAIRHGPNKGYGRFVETINGKRFERIAHRIAWQLANGPIPNGLLICHHCDNRRCCRPAHLFLGTYADNTADMVSKCRQWQQRKTHCKHGHEFTTENTRTQGVKRHCRECGRIRYRRAYAEGRISARVPTRRARKLTEGDVRAIRASDESNRSLGLKYGVHCATISKVRCGHRWAQVLL